VIKKSLSLSEILQGEGTAGPFEPALFLLFLTFFFTLLTENCRIPIDDPNTHLELTMIHEVMILDAGGPDLGILLYGSSIKLFLFMVLTSSILWPVTQMGLEGLGSLFLKTVGMSIAIGLIESSNARFRLMKVPQLLIANFVVTALAFLVILVGKVT
jgi:formate hydrogenlyase subunit 4